MHSTGTQGADDAAMERLWLQVCASRGTPAPNRAQCGWLLQDLGADERRMLESILVLAALGWEKPGDLSLLSWAAACTRPSVLSQLKNHGLAFSSADLFACGMKLREAGWDMQQRIAHRPHPEDGDTLRALLSALPPVAPGEPEADLQELWWTGAKWNHQHKNFQS